MNLLLTLVCTCFIVYIILWLYDLQCLILYVYILRALQPVLNNFEMIWELVITNEVF